MKKHSFTIYNKATNYFISKHSDTALSHGTAARQRQSQSATAIEMLKANQSGITTQNSKEYVTLNFIL